MGFTLGNTVANIGHSLGLPELGISEALGGYNQNTAFGGNPSSADTLAAQRLANERASGGSSLTPAQQYTYAYSPTGSVAGATTTAPTQTQQPSGGTPTGGGGGTSRDAFNAARSGGAYAGWGDAEAYADFLATGGPNMGGAGGPSQAEIDAQFNPIFDVYNQAESNLRGQQPGLISEAEAQAKASQGLLTNQRTSANELLGQQEQATNTQQQRQSAQQRQTLQELQQANQQRFGGASSAGLGASELQGREFQRSQFGIQENAQQALQAIGQQKLQVDREYQQGLQQLEVNKQQAVNEINRKFQDRLLEINARRGETEAAKAQARLSAVQELRNQAFQINVAKAQFEQDLKMQAQSNMQYLDQSANQFTGVGQSGKQAYNQFAQTTPTGISGVQSGSQGTTNQSLTGSISKRPEDYVGQIAGSSETDPRFQNYQPQQSRY